jgi:hypothetical protein
MAHFNLGVEFIEQAMISEIWPSGIYMFAVANENLFASLT